MDIDFRQILMGPSDKERGVGHRFEGDALIIECIGCEYMPDPGTKECMKCMVDMVCESGGADRIILRTGKDLEISGDPGQAIRRLASMKRSSFSAVRNKGRCRRCPSQRNTVMEAAWRDFPYPNYHGAREVLGDPDGEMCSRCMASTERALSQMESGMEDIRKELVGP